MRATHPLFRANPHCHWCGKSVLPIAMHEAKNREEMAAIATIDHVKSKGEAIDFKEYNSKENKVLSCYLCNQKRNSIFFKENSVKIQFNQIKFLKKEKNNIVYKEPKQIKYKEVFPIECSGVPSSNFVY